MDEEGIRKDFCFFDDIIVSIDSYLRPFWVILDTL